MADIMTQFAAEDAVSRESFNTKLAQANKGFEAAVKGAAVKNAPVDADGVVMVDSADGSKTKRVLWSAVKAALGAVFVPLGRKVNGKALSADIALSAADVGAASTSHGTHVTYSTTAPVMDGAAAVGTAGTVARGDHRHPTDTTRAAASHGTHVSYSTVAPVMDGAVTVGAAATVARSDHRHPVDTSRAAASHAHAASQVTAGTLGGQVLANATAQGNTGTAQLRNIYAGTGAMTAGTTALANGAIYCQYE